MSIKTTVGQVAMVGGDQYDQPSGILVDELPSRSGRGRRRGNLYVQVDVLGQAPGRSTIAKQLLQVVHSTYSGWRGSVTAGLQQAVREANEVLIRENQDSLPGERWAAGISCVVLRDRDLFIAQAGPTAVYLTREGQVTRFPEMSPWLDQAPPDEVEAVELGLRHVLHVDLYHSPVDTGDTFLLVESGLARRVSRERWSDICAHTSVEAVLSAVLTAGQGRDLSALAVRVGDGSATRKAVMAAEQESVLEGTEPDFRSVLEQLALWWKGLRAGERLQPLARALVAILSGLGAALLTLFQRMMPGQAGDEQAHRRQTSMRSGAPGSRGTTKSTTTADAQTELGRRVLVWLAVGIPLIVLVIVLLVNTSRGRRQRAEIEELWQNASTSWQLADSASDQATARTHLEATEGYLDELLTRQSQHAEAVELRGRVVAWLDEINGVRRINYIAALNTYPAGADLSRVVAESQHIFVMDRRAGKVYHHLLDSSMEAVEPTTTDTVLVTRGQSVGQVLVGDLVDMAWIPVGENRQKAALAILESNGALLEYDPATGELVPRSVAASDSWQFPRVIGGYSGRFYLLDSTASKIWRYDHALDGYSSQPYDWLQTAVDLAGVVDMAIGHSIYLLFSDGRIAKYSQGVLDTFDISDWDTPPSSPSALFTRPPEEVRSVYVADPANGRIVQCGKDGRFERQFRLGDSGTGEDGNALSAVTSLFVDEIAGRAFFLSGRKLYMIKLPDFPG